MTVRPAFVADVPAIAAVMVASWKGAYRGLMPDEIFDLVNYEVRLRQWNRYFAEPRPRHLVWVAEAATGEIVGMASIGPSRDDDLDSAVVADLSAIYVDPGHWGNGHGRDLMVTALQGTAALGFSEMALWVLHTNRRGRDFYESGGWAADGATKIDESFGMPLQETRYRIRLDGPPA
jgi:ribosomal protein S18 acetylase RimI-like enzyme